MKGCWKTVHGCNRKVLTLLLGTMLAIGVSACGTSTGKDGAQEVLSQKTEDQKRIKITVLVKHAFSIHKFEEEVEEKFPEIDLIQIGNYTRDMGIAEYKSRMEHDDLPDMVMTWPLDVGKEYWDDRLIDLSGMNFTSRYNMSMLNNIAKDGKLYYLPGPAQVRGIVYNKTMFLERGWEVPKDFDGFVRLCKEIEKSGMRSLQLGLGNGEVLDTAFIGFNYASHFSRPQDIQWLADYNNGKGSFRDHFDQALDTFLSMRDEGIFRASDLNLTYSDREKMFFTRQCAMIEDSVLLARTGFSQTGSTDEFALMPFFSDGKEEDWARLYMVCYIGLNKHLQEDGNKKKYDLALKLMDYISTPEGQNALSADTGAMVSNLSMVKPPDIPEIADLKDTLISGRYGIFPTFKNATPAFREGLGKLLKGEIHKEELIARIDEQNQIPFEEEVSEKLGTATKRFTLTDTGNFVTDTMAKYSGCEIALFLDNGKDGRTNAKGISASLYEGDVTKEDIRRILPDLKYGDTGMLNKGTITGADLLQTLEYAISVNNKEDGWFYYFSGLKMEYDPTAEPGKRIGKITTASGSPMELDKIYSIAIMENTIPESYLQTCEDAKITITELVEQAVGTAQTITPTEDGRFVLPK